MSTNTTPTMRASAPIPFPGQASPWLTVKQAANRAQCGTKLLYREVAAGRLKVARLGGRRELRFLPEWIDAWILDSITPKAA